MMRILGFALLLATLGGAPARALTLDWATVANPGNPDDSTGFGGVGYEFRISKHEVTNAQYTEFLNAVDPTGGNSLAIYNGNMATAAEGGIILNAAAPTGLKYEIKAGRGNNPVVYVSFFDAMRFVNWLENGQGSGGTESGAYAIGNGANEVRSPSARFFIPSEDEWYKAAYHKNDGVTGNYWDYPTSRDVVSYSDNPASLNTPDNANVANFLEDDSISNGYNGGYAVTDSPTFVNSQNYLTDVGAYSLAASPYGAYDQGGNVWEWNETVIGATIRNQRGGSWRHPSQWLNAAFRRSSDPAIEFEDTGFRVGALLDLPNGDFDGDGDVDGGDFLKWQRGESPSPMSASDLADWRAQFGTGGVSASAGLHSLSVPEPGTAFSGLLATAGHVLLKRRRARRSANMSGGYGPLQS
jgi:formylglycine-generating enzyme